MSFFRSIIGKERRSGKDRRTAYDSCYIGRKRRTGIERRKGVAKKYGVDKRTDKYEKLSNNQKKAVDHILRSLEEEDK